MTTELEQEFFNCFEIPKRYIYLVMDMGKSYICDRQTVIANKHLFSSKSRRCYVKAVNKVFPEITGRVLLRLIIIALNHGSRYRWINDTSNIEGLKSETLELLIKLAELLPHIKHQIQQLFKEGE